MNIAYSGFISNALDTGEELLIFRPEILLRVYGPEISAASEALVDTGADNTILPLSVARRLKIPTRPARGPRARAFGGQQISLSYADVPLEFSDENTSFRWLARVYFFDFPDPDSETFVVGHEEFLDFFTATFDGENLLLNIEPNQDFRPL